MTRSVRFARALDRFVLARSLSYLADALKTFIVPVLVFARTGSAVMSGIALAVEYVPKIVLMPFVGAFSQRFRLRPQFLAVDGVRAALCCLLIVVHSIGLIMAISALIAVFTSYAYVLNESLVAAAFADRERTVAQARLQAADQIARVAGPGLGAVLWVSFAGGIVPLAAGLFVLCGLGLFSLPPGADHEPVGAAGSGGVAHGFARGLAILRGSPPLVRLTFLLFATNFAAGVMLAIAPPMVADGFGLPLFYFGVLGSVASAATSGVMLLIGRFAPARPSAFGKLSLAAIVLSLALLCAAPSFAVFAAGYALLNVGNIGYATYMRVERLRYIPKRSIGETIGLLTSIVWLSVPLSGAAIALLVRPAGLRLTVVIASLVTVVPILLLYGRLGRDEEPAATAGVATKPA